MEDFTPIDAALNSGYDQGQFAVVAAGRVGDRPQYLGAGVGE